jgi:hypothetical protein
MIIGKMEDVDIKEVKMEFLLGNEMFEFVKI